MLMNLFDYIYFKVKRKEIRRGKCKLKKLKINTLLDILIANCKEKGIKYSVLEQRESEILVELIGKKERLVLKYEKADMIFYDEYHDFVGKIKVSKANKGVYITSGLFEGGLHGSRIMYSKKIILQDYTYFMKSQLGLRGKTLQVFKNKKLNFYKYLPR